jgi:hypothetical protein
VSLGFYLLRYMSLACRAEQVRIVRNSLVKRATALK